MRSSPFAYSGKWFLFSLVGACLVAVLHFSDSDDALMRFWLDTITPSSEKQAAVWLNDYEVDIDAQVVEGIDDNLSGLTWNSETSTLFAVTNGPNSVLELTPDGKLLRTVALEGFEDVEAIAWIEGHRFLVTDERIQSVIQIEIPPQASSISYDQFPQVQVATSASGNKGFEGIAWNPASQKVWVAKERDPMALYQITGFGSQGLGKKIQIAADMDLLEQVTRDKNDLSGLHYDQRTGNLLVLSDQSRVLAEVDENGDEVSSMDLGRLFAVSSHLPQPEGVTLDDQGNLYIVSEPNLLYRFRKPTRDMLASTSRLPSLLAAISQ
ncbi:SdiA-regulated domain-containing protein [Spongorhabdus nitratireducens]